MIRVARGHLGRPKQLVTISSISSSRSRAHRGDPTEFSPKRPELHPRIRHTGTMSVVPDLWTICLPRMRAREVRPQCQRKTVTHMRTSRGGGLLAGIVALALAATPAAMAAPSPTPPPLSPPPAAQKQSEKVKVMVLLKGQPSGRGVEKTNLAELNRTISAIQSKVPIKVDRRQAGR